MLISATLFRGKNVDLTVYLAKLSESSQIELRSVFKLTSKDG